MSLKIYLHILHMLASATDGGSTGNTTHFSTETVFHVAVMKVITILREH